MYHRYAVLRITNKCNYNCKFCNVWNEININSSKGFFIGKNDIFNFLKQSKTRYISISGGEPLLVIHNYLDIFGYFIKKGYIFDIQTTGYLLNNNMLTTLVKYGFKKFFISFHIHIPEVYNYLVGCKNNSCWKIVYKNLKNIDKYVKRYNIDVILNPVFNKITYKYLDDYFEFIYNKFKNIREISLSFIQPRDRALINRNLLLNERDYAVLRNKKDFLDKWFNRGFKIINPFCGLPLCCLGWYKYSFFCTDVIENFKKLKKGQSLDLSETYYDKKCDFCKWKYLCKGYWKNEV